ncbi:uncharacterized protein LOC124185324 [Neodiprion fabricii]|uniref:uncharacterized protein LOC124185324 n=1 Tax=Neodiprion fabricii TaxID=2872261 RepID=UPI001ED8F4D4|nr:uncharacterized protein LOC124185324 [Neodiprion fabricii]XP_046431935.1 uncharacterized protein LOC124185324 [Neodiprion fabricii]XP_046431936.1 uncharacterized protein LOC124185324 [Neodiprion fabricii]
MKVERNPSEDSKAESESSDFEELGDVASTKRIFSSSDGERTEIDDSDNDSGFVGVSQGSLDRLDTVTPEVPCTETSGSGPYDRDAILYELVSSGHPREARFIAAVERMKNGGVKSASDIYADFPDNFEYDASTLSQECRESMIEKLREATKPIPDSMLHLLTGRNRPGDCGRPSDFKPEWLDMEKIRRGQKFAQEHMFPIFFSEMLSLFALFSFEDGLKPLIMTGRSSTPFTAFKRYLSTGLRVRHWYTEDLWAKGSAARKDILTVRVMHGAAKRRLDASTNAEIDAAAKIPNAWCPSREMLLKDFAETCEAPVIGQCPYLIERNSPDRPKGINQTEMALTQWGFVGLIVSYPKCLGVHYATDEDLEAFCHLWRSIGYQLGMEDEYNFCRGTLEEIRQRGSDFLETWVKPNLRIITPEWEHMMRCIFTGVSVYLPGATYETSLLYLTEILDLQMPRLYASLSYKDWINFNLSKSLFYCTIKLPGMKSLFNVLLNRILDRAEKYTSEDIEAIRIKLSNFPGFPDVETAENPIATNS